MHIVYTNDIDEYNDEHSVDEHNDDEDEINVIGELVAMYLFVVFICAHTLVYQKYG